MTLQLIPERPSCPVPTGELRLAVSWCRNGGVGLSGRVKKLRGMLFNVKPVEAKEARVKRLSRFTYNDEFLAEL